MITWSTAFGPAPENLVLIPYAETSTLNTHADVSSGVRVLKFGLMLHLHPYFVYASSEGYGESVHMHRLAWASVARKCNKYLHFMCWPMSSIDAVGNVSNYRCVSGCRSWDREFDPGPVPYYRGDWSWNNFYGHSPPFRWLIQEGLLSVTSENMYTKYWLTACSSLLRKKVWLHVGELTVPTWP